MVGRVITGAPPATVAVSVLVSSRRLSGASLSDFRALFFFFMSTSSHEDRARSPGVQRKSILTLRSTSSSAASQQARDEAARLVDAERPREQRDDEHEEEAAAGARGERPEMAGEGHGGRDERPAHPRRRTRGRREDQPG